MAAWPIPGGSQAKVGIVSGDTILQYLPDVFRGSLNRRRCARVVHIGEQVEVSPHGMWVWVRETNIGEGTVHDAVVS